MIYMKQCGMNVDVVLQSDDALSILDLNNRPWPKLKEGTEASTEFYRVHDRNKHLPNPNPSPYPDPDQNPKSDPNPSVHFIIKADLATLQAYESKQDLATYVAVLREVLEVFGKGGIHESLIRTMGNYLEVTGGWLANSNKSEWEKDVAARMICTNNPAEGPFATVRAFLQIYPNP
jgi:hypothetical protein